MQVILMEKVHNLGQLGDIVKVKDGFARNFLIPQGKAKRATDKAIAEFQSAPRRARSCTRARRSRESQDAPPSSKG